MRGLIDEFAPSQLRLITAVRRSLRKLLPTAYEVVYEYRNLGAVVLSFSPNEHGYDGVVGIRATADSVRLYFSLGKELPDPEKRLRGSAQTRFIELDGTSTLALPAVECLIVEAIARTRVPFAEIGSGPVIIRSTSAKK